MHDELERTSRTWTYRCGTCRRAVSLWRRSVWFAQFEPVLHDECLPRLIFAAFTKCEGDPSKWRELFAFIRSAQPNDILKRLSA